LESVDRNSQNHLSSKGAGKKVKKGAIRCSAEMSRMRHKFLLVLKMGRVICVQDSDGFLENTLERGIIFNLECHK